MRILETIGRKILNVAQGTGEMLALLLETVYYCKEAPRNWPARHCIERRRNYGTRNR